MSGNLFNDLVFIDRNATPVSLSFTVFLITFLLYGLQEIGFVLRMRLM